MVRTIAFSVRRFFIFKFRLSNLEVANERIHQLAERINEVTDSLVPSIGIGPTSEV